MSRWYRAYEGTVTDAKLAEVAMIAGCSRSVVIATWHAVLENAATVNDGGRIDIPSRRIAAILCEPFDVIETVMLGFETVGIVADSAVAAWKRRQYESDSSTERSRKHRNAKRNDDATLQQQDATPPETETETETENSVSNETALVDPEKVMFDHGIALLTSCGRSESSARSWLGRAKREHGAEMVITMIGRAKREGAVDPVSFMEGGFRAKARASPDNIIC